MEITETFRVKAVGITKAVAPFFAVNFPRSALFQQGSLLRFSARATNEALDSSNWRHASSVILGCKARQASLKFILKFIGLLNLRGAFQTRRSVLMERISKS